MIEIATNNHLSWETNARWFTFLLITTFLPFYFGLTFFFLSLFVMLAISKPSCQWMKVGSIKITFSIFIVFSLLVSLIHSNVLGILISIYYIFVYFFFNYYQEKVRPDYLDTILTITLWASFLLFFYSVLEHFQLIGEWDYSFILPNFGKEHPERVETTFFNPNYYALMLEFFILIGLYKIERADERSQKGIYLLITLCNVLAIYFTGNRSTPLVFVSTVVIFYFLLGKIKTAFIALFLLGSLFLALFFTENYPRMENLSWALKDRFLIWETALKGIRDNFLFGQGPLTYRNIYELYGGQETYHAHNIILDTLLSYGVLGTSLLLYPVTWFLKLLWKMKDNKKLRSQFALYGSLISAVVIHGMVDLGIFWFQTGIIFLLIMLTAPNLMRKKNFMK